MSAEPLDYASPRAVPRQRRRFGFWHVGSAVGLWLAFAAPVMAALFAGRGGRVTALATGAGVAAGPMVGAWSRDYQSCCLRSSLQLFLPCGATLLAAFLIQGLIRPGGRWRAFVRRSAWAVGLVAWFGGAILSLVHAMS